MPLLEFLQKQSRTAIIAAGIVLVLALWAVDYRTGPEFSFVTFYLAPVFLVAWFAGEGPGIWISLLCGAAWYTADVLSLENRGHPAITYLNLLTKLGFFAIVSHILSTLRGSLERERERARTDYLTQVSNSRFFAEIAGNEIRRAGRYQHPFTIAYLDIDNFKTVNDEWGHSTGDLLLTVVAETIRKNIRSTDVVARLGGDEFALLLPETGYDAAEIVIQKVHQSLLAAMIAKAWPVTFSVGVVTFLTPPESVDRMINIADGFMYSVKHGGKNMIIHKQIEYQAG